MKSIPTKPKADRLDLRIQPETKDRIIRAARLQGRSVTDFVVSAASEAANQTLQRTEILELTARDSAILAEKLLRPPNPGTRLKAAAARYRKLQVR